MIILAEMFLDEIIFVFTSIVIDIFLSVFCDIFYICNINYINIKLYFLVSINFLF